MDSCSSVAYGRRAVSSPASRFFHAASLVLLCLLGMAWSGQSLAQSCDFVVPPPNPTSGIGQPGTQLSFVLEAQTACAPTVNISIAVTADTTGGASIVPPAATTILLDTPYTFTLDLGPTPGGTGTVVATCLSGGCAGDTLTYTFATNNDFDFTAINPAVVANQITPFTVGSNILLNGSPAGLSTLFDNATTGTIYGTFAPNGAGDATTTQSLFTAGTYLVRGFLQCPIAFVLEGCAAVPQVNVNVLIEPVSVTHVGSPTPATTSGVALPLVVRYGSASIPAVDGSAMTWTVAGPAGHDGVVTGNPVAGGAGESAASFIATVVGTYTVTANSGCTFCAVGAESFTVTVNAAPFVLVPISANPAAGTVGSPLQARVRLEQGGSPISGAAIQWTATAPFTPATITTTTGGTGNTVATFTPSATGNFPGAITATYDPDGIPANGDEVNYVFDASITAATLPYNLVALSANPAGGTPGSPVAFAVRLDQAGTPVNAATIQWTANAPFAPGSLSSPTNAAGDATASFTPSAAGTFTGAVTALFDPDGIPANGNEATVVFDANIAATPGLAITGGDGQSALIGAAFAAPLTVAADNSGVPAAGVTINWSVTGPATLVAGGPTDAASGSTGATVTAGATAGNVTITATRADSPSATVTFHLTVTGLGSLSIVSGDGQSLVVGTPSAPMEVELKDAGGVPIAGATVAWATSAGTLASASSVTDAAGRTSNTVTSTDSSAIQVTASSPLAAAPAVFGLSGALADLPGLDPVQRSVAEAMDNACPALAALSSPNAAQADLLQRCKDLGAASGIDPAAAVVALDQLMADVALTQANAAFNAAQSQFQNLKTRIAALRSGTGGTSFGGLAINTSTGPISLGMLANALSGEDAAPTEIGADFSRWGFFAAGNIGRGEADGGNVDPAYDYDLDGITLGVDYRKSDQWIFGGSLGYTRQDTTLPGERGGLDTSGWSVSAYSTYYQQDSWYMDGVVTWGSNDYELLRRIQYTLPLPGGGTSTIDQVADSDSTGDLLSTAFTFGRDFNRGALGIGPYGRLLYTRLSFDEIREDLLPGQPGSGLGLEIDSRELTSLASVIGTKFTYTYSTDWGVLMPHASLEWEHEFKDDPQSVEARFINDPTGSAMVINGDPLDTDYFRLGLGMSMVLTRGRSGFFYYERLVGRNGISQWNLALGLRMEF